MARLLADEPIRRERVLWHDEPDGAVVVESKADVREIVELNTIDRNAREGFRHGDFFHVARIPLVVYEDLMRKGIAGDPKALKKWLDDPDNRAFRTHPGKLSR